jgi:hypothetical protein
MAWVALLTGEFRITSLKSQKRQLHLSDIMDKLVSKLISTLVPNAQFMARHGHAGRSASLELFRSLQVQVSCMGLALRGRCWTADRRLRHGLLSHTLCPLCSWRMRPWTTYSCSAPSPRAYGQGLLRPRCSTLLFLRRQP